MHSIRTCNSSCVKCTHPDTSSSPMREFAFFSAAGCSRNRTRSDIQALLFPASHASPLQFSFPSQRHQNGHLVSGALRASRVAMASTRSMSSGNLMDTEPVDGEQIKSGRRLRRRTTADMVEKVLKVDFKGYSAQDIDGTMVEGATLRQKLREDKRQNMKTPSSMRMGSHSNEKIEDLFPAGDCIAATLEVQDNSAAIQEDLVGVWCSCGGGSKTVGL